MEIIQMQRRQQLLIQQQQQQQLEMKQREDDQRSLVAQLAGQDADVYEAGVSFFHVIHVWDLISPFFIIIGRAKTGAAEAGSVVGSATATTASTTPKTSICAAYTFIVVANHNRNHTHAANTTQRTQSSRGHRHLPKVKH
jgi:hypothetical protein